MDEDGDLVERIAAGDRSAEDRLCVKYGQRILLYARHRLGNDEDARDICQETLMAVVTALRTRRIRAPEKLASYIYTVCRNRIIDTLAKLAREVPVEDVHRIEISLEPKQDQILGEHDVTALRRSLSKLKPIDRKILYLRYFSRLRYEDIGAMLGLTVDALKKRAERARNKLRRDLKKSVTFLSL